MMKIPSGKEFKDAFSETFFGLTSRPVLVFCVFCALVAAVAGPFGTYSALEPVSRMAYWLSVVILSVPLAHTARAICLAFMREKPPIVRNAASVFLASVLITGLVWFETYLFTLGNDTKVPTFWELATYVFLITALVGSARQVFEQYVSRRHANPDQQAAPSAEVDTAGEVADCVPRLVRRLSDDWEGSVCNLSVEDHLVTVRNNHRREKLRMRFGDAIEEMDGVKGIRVHRSHWVAEHAIREIERDRGRVFVKLTNGERVPVSRTYQSELEDRIPASTRH